MLVLLVCETDGERKPLMEKGMRGNLSGTAHWVDSNCGSGDGELHAVLGVLVGVDDAVGGASAGPDEEQDVFAGWGGVDF